MNERLKGVTVCYALYHNDEIKTNSITKIHLDFPRTYGQYSLDIVKDMWYCLVLRKDVSKCKENC